MPGRRGEGAGRAPEESSRTREQACEQARESRGGASSQVTLEVFTQPRPTSYFSLHLAWIHLYASGGAIALEPADGLERMLRVGMLVVVCFGGAASTYEGAPAGGLNVLGGPGVLSLDGPDAEGVLPIQHATEAVPVRWIGEPARDRRVDRDRRAFPRRRRSCDRCAPRPGRTPLRRRGFPLSGFLGGGISGANNASSTRHPAISGLRPAMRPPKHPERLPPLGVGAQGVFEVFRKFKAVPII